MSFGSIGSPVIAKWLKRGSHASKQQKMSSISDPCAPVRVVGTASLASGRWKEEVRHIGIEHICEALALSGACDLRGEI
jgi:hypothetical protein